MWPRLPCGHEWKWDFVFLGWQGKGTDRKTGEEKSGSERENEFWGACGVSWICLPTPSWMRKRWRNLATVLRCYGNRAARCSLPAGRGLLTHPWVFFSVPPAWELGNPMQEDQTRYRLSQVQKGRLRPKSAHHTLSPSAWDLKLNQNPWKPQSHSQDCQKCCSCQPELHSAGLPDKSTQERAGQCWSKLSTTLVYLLLLCALDLSMFDLLDCDLVCALWINHSGLMVSEYLCYICCLSPKVPVWIQTWD